MCGDLKAAGVVDGMLKGPSATTAGVAAAPVVVVAAVAILQNQKGVNRAVQVDCRY